jgi:hypothetical protein
MKHVLLLCASVILFAATSAKSQPLTVHEWGTFTTLHSSEGETLSGLYFEEEALPPFVYHFPGFSPDPNTRPCNNVTVKMETPVLYFYSSVQKPVQVHVDFPNGMISEWYPDRIGGEETPAGILDFGAKHTGAIDWSATILPPTSTASLTQQSSATPFHKWTDPRATDANLVQNNNGEVEKYLFYRGIANFPLPVDVSFLDSTHLSITNNSKLDLPFVFIYDHTNANDALVWGSGPLKSGASAVYTSKNGHSFSQDNPTEFSDFKNALIAAGLTTKEAQAMLNTWEDGYFQTVGFKIFWIVPRTITDQIIPLTITPTPDTLNRVLVGKTEVLTKQFERQLLADYRAGKMSKYASDRYHLAYAQRAQELDLEYPVVHPFTVHEFGTFTSLHASHGEILSGLYVEEQPLPGFVHYFQGFLPDPVIYTLGYQACRNVTVKLEQPVLNFYSDIERSVEVGVDFPNGMISQWYPNRNGGQVQPNTDTIDFASAQHGSVQWTGTVLAKNTEQQVSHTSDVTGEWSSLRQSANLVSTPLGETENFMFYNGIANITLPIEIYFPDSNQLIVRNNSTYDIPLIYILDHTSDGYRTWGGGPIAQGESKVFTVPGSYGPFFYSDPMQSALVSAGLRTGEATSLLNSQGANYFTMEGFKVFWIMPSAMADQILPLTVNPWPDTTRRVFVGKTEILTIQFEKELVDYYTLHGNLDKWRSHPYYLAYLERVKQLYKPSAGVTTPISGDGIALVPNPADTKVSLLGISPDASVSVRNLLGQTLIHFEHISIPEIDIHSLPDGIYFVTVGNGSKTETLKLVKR